jgi:hypothetical protein
VYHGALYVGEAPFSLWLPLNQLDYVNVLTTRGEESRAVFYGPENADIGLTVSLSPKIFPRAGERRVNKARGRYYWAWGGTWLAAITAWIASGISTGYDTAYRTTGNPELNPMQNGMYWISLSAIIATGLVAGYHFFELFRYINTTTKYTAPIVKTEKKK